MYFSQIHSEAFYLFVVVFFRKGFHVNLVFFLCFHILYFFTVQLSQLHVVFLHHSLAQISNITVLLFSRSLLFAIRVFLERG